MTKIKPKLIHSDSFDPWHNLALEEVLLSTIQPDEVVLYLWQNDNTVVIGKNQNPWKECVNQRLEEGGCKLARRLSGGGAVYHDLGNLNFTFVMHKAHYNVKKQQQVIVDALKRFDVDAVFSGRNDMLIHGRKFSGHAYYNNGTNAYHHGTLLVNVDFDKMMYYLNPSSAKIRSKSVESVRSRVINIVEVAPTLSIDQIKESMEESFCNLYGKAELKTVEGLKHHIPPLYEKYASWDWRYGHSPRFDVTFDRRFDWGEVQFNFNLEKGRISECKLYTDAMEVELLHPLAASLQEETYERNRIAEAAKNHISDPTVRNDIVGWIENWEL